MLFLHGVSAEISSLPCVISSGILKARDWKLTASDRGDLSLGPF